MSPASVVSSVLQLLSDSHDDPLHACEMEAGVTKHVWDCLTRSVTPNHSQRIMSPIRRYTGMRKLTAFLVSVPRS